MEGSSSSNSGYPYPSHVCAPNFVTVRLNGRDTYDVWKTQMLCLLESHDMIAFITHAENMSVKGKEKDGDYLLWRRSDALVKGWILGSLSQQTLKCVVKRSTNFTSKDVWDTLQTIYGPVLQQAVATDLDDNKEERITREAGAIIQENSMSQDSKSNDQEIREAADERAKVHQSLYEAILSQSFEEVYSILAGGKVSVTDNIAINGNTTLHLVIGITKKRETLEKMLEMAPQGNTILDMKNSEGSTLLHVAAIVGNTEAAKMLVEANKDLLFAEDNEGQTPVARALSNMHTDTYLYLLNPTSINAHDIEMATLFVGINGDELLVNAISSKDYHSALVLISKHYNNIHSDASLMALAQNFPPKLNNWERTVYGCLLIILS